MDMFERGYVTPNDAGVMAETDSRSIQKAVDTALETGLGRVVIPRYNKRTGRCQWDVDEAVILDSNLEIVLDNCYIRQMDGSMDNVFRNFHDGQERKTLAEEQHDIIIRGVGKAVIDGGIGNGLTQKTSLQDGRPHIHRNNVILLHNLRDFKLQNFTVCNQRHWAIHLAFVEKGIISGLNLICENNLKNQDGLDLRLGCNNILIENMTGQAGDDFIALSGFLSKRVQERYVVEGKSIDIHDILIRNIMATSAECTLIALRNQDGIKIYNVTIDHVFDVMTTTEGTKEGQIAFGFDRNKYLFPKSPYAVLRIGHDLFSSIKRCAPGDVHSIHVNDLHARCNNAVILNMELENSSFRNIYAGNTVDCVISTKSERSDHAYGVNMRNTVFENIFYECADNPDSVAFDFALNTKDCVLENVEIRNAYLGNCRQVLNMQHKGTLKLTNIHGENVKEKVTVEEDATVVWDGESLTASSPL